MVWIAVAAAVLTLAAMILAYRRDRRLALRAVSGASVVRTAAGPVEYALRGSGPAILCLHGSGGGWDQGMAIASAFLPEGFRIIAPSRLGYLGTVDVPQATPEQEADTCAELLDRLGIDRAVVVGTSAGARTALELALRHPRLTVGLVLVVPATHAPGDAVRIEPSRASAVAFRVVNAGADIVWWAMARFAPGILLRFLDVSRQAFAAAGAAEQERALAMVRAMLPLSHRVRGINRDSLPDGTDRPLASIRAPTLVVAARDDLFNTYPSARHLHAAIPGAQILVFETGGHLLVGRRDEVATAVARFLNGLAPPA